MYFNFNKFWKIEIKAFEKILGKKTGNFGIFAEKFAKNGKTGENIAKIVGKTDNLRA